MPTKGRIPTQLRSWHQHVAFVRDRYPDTPYTEILQIASKSYKKGGVRHATSRRSSRAPSRRSSRAHSRRSSRSHSRRRTRGGGIISTIGHAVGDVADFFGLGNDPNIIAGLKRRRRTTRKRGGTLQNPNEIAGRKRRVTRKAPVKRKSRKAPAKRKSRKAPAKRKSRKAVSRRR